MTTPRYAAVLVAAALLAACGGNDSDELVRSTEGTATNPASDTAVSVDATLPDSGPVNTGSPITQALDDDSPVPSTNVQAPPDNSAAESTVEPDDRALALIARGLYSVPGAETHCESTTQRGARIKYAFPAEGGDLFALCLVEQRENGDPLTEARLRLVDPAGRTLVDVIVNEVVAGDDGIDGRLRALLELTYADSRQVLHGGRLGFDPLFTEFSVPIFLPHDRPAGSWSLSFGGAIADPVDIDAPCAEGSGEATGDPLNVRTNLRFIREGPIDGDPPVPFEHCRIFPDVVGMTITDAKAVVGPWAVNLGVSVEYRLVAQGEDDDPPCGPDAIVKRSSPRAGEFDGFRINMADKTVDLTPVQPCRSEKTDDSSPDDTTVGETDVVDPTTTTTTTEPVDDEPNGPLTTEPPVDTSNTGELTSASLPSDEATTDQ